MASVPKGKSNSRRAAFKTDVPALKLVDTTPSSSRKEVVLKPRTPTQRFYIKELQHGTSSFVVATGPAGTGKTFIAVCHAIQLLREGTIKKIIISRPNVEAGDPLGFLPGDIVEKLGPYVAPIIDIFEEFYSPYQVEQMIKNKTIEIVPVGFCRGRTFKDAFLILDEAQNLTPDQMLMLLTRIGEGSRYVITGDPRQHDRPGGGISGLVDLMRRLNARIADEDEEVPEGSQHSNFSVFQFAKRDVVRHAAIPEVLELYAA